MYHLRYHAVNVSYYIVRVQEKFAYTLQNQTEVQARVIENDSMINKKNTNANPVAIVPHTVLRS